MVNSEEKQGEGWFRKNVTAKSVFKIASGAYIAGKFARDIKRSTEMMRGLAQDALSPPGVLSESDLATAKSVKLSVYTPFGGRYWRKGPDGETQILWVGDCETSEEFQKSPKDQRKRGICVTAEDAEDGVLDFAHLLDIVFTDKQMETMIDQANFIRRLYSIGAVACLFFVIVTLFSGRYLGAFMILSSFVCMGAMAVSKDIYIKRLTTKKMLGLREYFGAQGPLGWLKWS